MGENRIPQIYVEMCIKLKTQERYGIIHAAEGKRSLRFFSKEAGRRICISLASSEFFDVDEMHGVLMDIIKSDLPERRTYRDILQERAALPKFVLNPHFAVPTIN